MITTAFLALSGFALTPQLADTIGMPPLEPPHTVSLAVAFDETHFSAQNLDEVPLLLTFASVNREVETAFWLPAGWRYEEDFPRGTLDGVQLEVFATRPDGWMASGALALESFAPDGSGQLWVLSCGHAVIRGGEGESLVELTPAGSLLPPRVVSFLRRPEPHAHAAPEPLHVPVPRPIDAPKGDKPPKLEKKPLPPV